MNEDYSYCQLDKYTNDDYSYFDYVDDDHSCFDYPNCEDCPYYSEGE